MAVPRTAWVFLWVLRALHSTRGQLTECTAQTLGAQCFLSEQDVSVGCGTATDVGVCSRDAGFSCSLGDQSVPSTGDVCYEPGACWCRSGVCINRGGSDLCGFTPAITRACTPEDAKAPCFLSERDVSAGCGSDTDIGSCEPFTSDDDVVCALVETLVVPESATNGNVCHEPDGCACFSGLCLNNVPDGLCAFTSVCADGTDMCDDPHMKGLRGQRIDWSGVDGGWYSMIRDDTAHLQVNVRLTAPLPEDFPDRQLITGLSVLSEGHSFVVEVKNPYDIHTNGCPPGISPCLADGGLRAVVDGVEADDLLRFSKDAYAADGLIVSASNLPTECRQFGGDKIWARMYDEMLQGTRQLGPEETFEDWIMRFEDMAAPNWCAQYIDQHDLADLQSVYAVFKIVTSSVTVRLNVGPNTQGGGDLDWDGRILPDMEFWQMDVGLHGLSLENESLSGILGETARPVLDEHGREVMEGFDAFRGTVQDYRVSGPLGTDFGLLHL